MPVYLLNHVYILCLHLLLWSVGRYFRLIRIFKSHCFKVSKTLKPYFQNLSELGSQWLRNYVIEFY